MESRTSSLLLVGSILAFSMNCVHSRSIPMKVGGSVYMDLTPVLDMS